MSYIDTIDKYPSPFEDVSNTGVYYTEYNPALSSPDEYTEPTLPLPPYFTTDKKSTTTTAIKHNANRKKMNGNNYYNSSSVAAGRSKITELTEPVVAPSQIFYHYNDAKDWQLLDTDLRPHRKTLINQFSLWCLLAAFIEFLPFCWTIVVFSIWGISYEAVINLVFFIHVLKSMLILMKVFVSTDIYKYYGRISYHWLWGIWSRTSHVRGDKTLVMYSVIYGYVHIPMMLLFLLIAAGSYPLFTSSIAYWITWPMAIVSICVGYITWCIIISETGIRKPLERYVDFTRRDRERTRERMIRESPRVLRYPREVTIPPF